MKTITIFGDSLAKGIQIKNGRPELLSNNAVNYIQEKLAIDIQNLSVFGQTITRLYDKKLVQNYLKNLDMSKENIVVFCIGGNDCDFNWKEVAKNPLIKHDCKTPIQIFNDTYKKLISLLKNKKVKVYICALPCICPKLFLNNYIGNQTDLDKILKYFDDDISYISRHQEKYNNALKDIAKDTNSCFLDIRLPFLQEKNICQFYSIDGIHLNEKGQLFVANTILNIIKK